jgi:hypothetical protein
MSTLVSVVVALAVLALLGAVPAPGPRDNGGAALGRG